MKTLNILMILLVAVNAIFIGYGIASDWSSLKILINCLGGGACITALIFNQIMEW